MGKDLREAIRQARGQGLPQRMKGEITGVRKSTYDGQHHVEIDFSANKDPKGGVSPWSSISLPISSSEARALKVGTQVSVNLSVDEG